MKEPQSASRFTWYAPVVLRALVLLVLLGQFAAALVEWSVTLSSRWDIDYAERWLAFAAQQAYPAGEHVADAKEIPHNALPYPPLSFLVHGSIGRLVGADLLTVRKIGRTTALLMTLLSGLLVMLNARALGAGPFWCVLAGLLFWTALWSHLFAVSVRADEMACALTLLGLYAVLRFRNFWAAGALFGLAMAAKHSSLSVPLVVTMTLIFQRDARSALKLVGSGCLVGVILMGLGRWLLGPNWWQGCLLQGFHGADVKQAIGFLGQGVQQPAIVIGLASLFVPGLRRPVTLVVACLIVSLGFNSLALVKVGAAQNYFLEPAALGVILGSHVLSCRILPEQPPAWKGFTWAVLLALVIPMAVTQSITTMHTFKDRDSGPNVEPILTLLEETDGPVLVDQSGFYFSSGKAPYLCPPDLIMAAVEGGKIDGSAMTTFIERQKFKTIVVRKDWKEKPHFPHIWIAAIEEHYEMKADGDYLVWKPKAGAAVK